jgi:hypothetical protein
VSIYKYIPITAQIATIPVHKAIFAYRELAYHNAHLIRPTVVTGDVSIHSITSSIAANAAINAHQALSALAANANVHTTNAIAAACASIQWPMSITAETAIKNAPQVNFVTMAAAYLNAQPVSQLIASEDALTSLIIHNIAEPVVITASAVNSASKASASAYHPIPIATADA